jgi:hypothetical protein
VDVERIDENLADVPSQRSTIVSAALGTVDYSSAAWATARLIAQEFLKEVFVIDGNMVRSLYTHLGYGVGVDVERIDENLADVPSQRSTRDERRGTQSREGDLTFADAMATSMGFFMHTLQARRYSEEFRAAIIEYGIKVSTP